MDISDSEYSLILEYHAVHDMTAQLKFPSI